MSNSRKKGLRYNTAPVAYRPCVGVMLADACGRVWVGRRRGTAAGWQMPQGGIDPGETALQAALRELEEETGTRKADLVAESTVWRRYDLPAHLIGKVWGGRFRGQEQRWFLLNFTGSDADINIATEEPEFDDWRWVEPREVLELIVPFKRAVYDDVIAEFEPSLRSLAGA